MMLRMGRIVGVASALLLSGCFASISSVAHDTFVRDTGCPNPEERAVDEETGVVEIAGCGRHSQFTCAPGYQPDHRRWHEDAQPTTCSYRMRYAISSTDGAWQDDWNHDAAAHDAAMRSAAHDIPCALGALTYIDGTTVDGCGQRVVYEEVPALVVEAPASKSGYRNTTASKYLLASRVSLQTPAR